MRLWLRYGHVEIHVEAEGVSYAPDVLADQATQALKLFEGVLEEVVARGLSVPINLSDEGEAETEDEG